MLRALNAAATGMAAQQTHIDVVANNVANVNTTGFRRARAEFQDLLYQTHRTAGAVTANGGQQPTGLQVGLGTRTVATETLFEQGTLQQTGNALDLAIEGEGFFQVTRNDGTIAYTRSGNFKVDAEGRLCTVDGLPVEPAVQIPPDATGVTVSPTGVVSATQPGQSQPVELGQIQIVRFSNPAGLTAIGRTMYLQTPASGEPIVLEPGTDGAGTLAQGFLEGSNVQIVNEMIDLISSQRAYDINQRVIQAADEMLRKVTER
jgi:flagellar basal-body rod protein FlgG